MAVARSQEESGEIWGYPVRGGIRPRVRAWSGALPPGKRGIEFTTDVLPDPGGAPGRPEWSGPRPGVRIEADAAGDPVAKIAVEVTKNTQA